MLGKCIPILSSYRPQKRSIVKNRPIYIFFFSFTKSLKCHTAGQEHVPGTLIVLHLIVPPSPLCISLFILTLYLFCEILGTFLTKNKIKL